jgi:hypothetical protein
MMLSQDELRERAQRALAKLNRARRDPRYARAMGRFVAAGLLETNDPRVVPHHEPVALDDVLWAGQHEPRLLELLPAVVVKRPALLAQPFDMPADLRDAVRAIRSAKACPEFRGVSGDAYARWVPFVGTRRAPTQLKSFRLKPDDLHCLRRLVQALPARSETEVVRIALRKLERELLDADG